MHLRKCLFGLPFWVNKTRTIKMSQASGFDAFSFTNRININDELWTLTALKDPVIDESGKPVTGIEPLIDDSPEPVEEKEEFLETKQREEELEKRLIEEATLSFADIKPPTPITEIKIAIPIEEKPILLMYTRMYSPSRCEHIT